MQIEDLSDNALKFWLCFFRGPRDTLRFGGDHAKMEITPTAREALDQLLSVGAAKPVEPNDSWPRREHYGSTGIDLREVALARHGGDPEKASAWLYKGEFVMFRKKVA